jgi:hypothetical protein
MTDGPDPSRFGKTLTLALTMAVLASSAWVIGDRVVAFLALDRGEAERALVVAPLVNYLFGSLGFLCLLGWAVLAGTFSDTEEPKYNILETEKALGLATGAAAPKS